MSDSIEIYVRPKGEGGKLHLNLHLSKSARRALLEGLRAGTLSGDERPIYLEMSVLQEWIRDEEIVLPEGASIHLRLPISAINIYQD